MGSMSAPVECLEIGSLIINREHRDVLDRLGFLDFDSIWNWKGGDRIKDIHDRSVLRIPLEQGGRKTYVYLKKHTGGRVVRDGSRVLGAKNGGRLRAGENLTISVCFESEDWGR